MKKLSLLEVLEGIEDTRREQSVWYPLHEVLFIMIVAVICVVSAFSTEDIPPEKIATYGQIARLIGRENNSRLVGKILAMSQQYGEYPCHRVVNHAGRMVPG